jgi:hypothetical protein
VLSYLAGITAVIAVPWLLWRLSRPVFMFFIDEGIVGRWRWVREKVFTPILYGSKGK